MTQNTDYDGFPSLSPDGTRIVFESNRRRTGGEPLNIADLYVMNADGTNPVLLTRGSSATWSPDSREVAFHASASGTAPSPNTIRPGFAPTDSDIFVMRVNDSFGNRAQPKNITNTPGATDDDADWSPRGRQMVFTSRASTETSDNNVTAEIYLIEADGGGMPVRLTSNTEEERSPAWSPDGSRIAFMCRRGGRDFEICVMNADGTSQVQVTDNDLPDLTPSWSPDGKKIVFHRPVGGAGRFQLFLINVDGTAEAQLTSPPGLNAFPNWGELRSPGRAR